MLSDMMRNTKIKYMKKMFSTMSLEDSVGEQHDEEGNEPSRTPEDPPPSTDPVVYP